jgi:putative ABC transport system permease protein
VTARLAFSGLLGNGRSSVPIMGEGIEADQESTIGPYLRLLEGRALSSASAYEALIGEGLARTLKLRPGDQANLVVATAEGAMNTLDFEIVGITQSFSKEYDARVVKIPLEAAQELLSTSGSSVVVVLLKSREGVEATGEKLKRYAAGRGLEARTWRELSDFYDKTVGLYQQQFGILRLIILVMVVLSVRNTLTMTLSERASEFGTMQALGLRSGQVFRVILVESCLLGMLGATLGCVVGVAAAYGISAFGIPMPPPPNSNLGYLAEIQVVPSVMLGAFLVGCGATILASVLPAARISRMPIAEALRRAL